MTKKIEARLAELEARVSTLEGGAAKAPSGRLWALETLRGQPNDELVFAGTTSLPSGEHFEWQQGALSDTVLERDWAESAPSLAALGHPLRLTILRAALQGAHTTVQLQDAVSLNTTGQLYHHLKQLVAAGWLHADGGGRYHVPAGRVVPLLVLMEATRPPGE